jgi:predicted phosphodiesterase
VTTRFIVVADSHIRFPDDDVGTYPSNALMVGRNEFVVEVCNDIDASFVAHLGDIVHPIPAEDGHEPAVELAAGVYEHLRHPIHFVPGNHDIGDKPNAFVAVPPVADGYYPVFERHWGPAFRSFEEDGLHFVFVDTPVLNSGLEREAAQRAWLEVDLATAAEAGHRVFLFTHYPPFVRHPGENEHYDNLGEPARSWLLDLIDNYRVEAVFSGHLHNFVYNHHRGTEFYIVPSTGFVRPDYSELSAAPPESEGGRDDPPKLGFFVVEVDDDGHSVRPVRTYGATGPAGQLRIPLEIALDPDWDSPIGATMRHGWISDTDFPTAGLDEFSRKTVRNDATLPALWEARIHRLRIPLADAMRRPERIAHLAGRGTRFTVVSAGLPEAAALRAVTSLAGVERWEFAIPPHSFAALHESLGNLALPPGVRVAVGPIVPIGPGEAAVHHFVTTGFAPTEPGLLESWISGGRHHDQADLVFRADPSADIADSVAAAGRMAANAGVSAVVLVELPRAAEATPFTDDLAVSDRVAAAVAAAQGWPEVTVFLDGFMDHDRGYYPRHGLIDRHHNPREALYRLIQESARRGR